MDLLGLNKAQDQLDDEGKGRHRMNRLLRVPALLHLTGFSRSTLYARCKVGLYPRPVTLGERMSVWPESEIVAMNNATVSGATDDEIRSLVARLEAERRNAA